MVHIIELTGSLSHQLIVRFLSAHQAQIKKIPTVVVKTIDYEIAAAE